MLTNTQSAALCFALTEGRVAPGCRGLIRSALAHELTLSDIAPLVDRGLLEFLPLDDDSPWFRLTAKGEEIAHAVFTSDRGYDWKGSSQ